MSLPLPHVQLLLLISWRSHKCCLLQNPATKSCHWLLKKFPLLGDVSARKVASHLTEVILQQNSVRLFPKSKAIIVFKWVPKNVFPWGRCPCLFLAEDSASPRRSPSFLAEAWGPPMRRTQWRTGTQIWWRELTPWWTLCKQVSYISPTPSLGKLKPRSKGWMFTVYFKLKCPDLERHKVPARPMTVVGSIRPLICQIPYLGL